MNTTFLTIALAGSLLAAENANPTWQANYGQAQQQCVAQKKPLAIVFGTGSEGWAKIVRAESPSPEVTKMMADSYVCVYVDTATPAGKKLSQSFGITGNVGMVLSDRAGTTQAFWHQGDMTNQMTAGYLKKYADPEVVVRGTETAGSRTSFYPPTEAEGVNWGAVSGGGSYCPSCNNARRR